MPHLCDVEKCQTLGEAYRCVHIDWMLVSVVKFTTMLTAVVTLPAFRILHRVKRFARLLFTGNGFRARSQGAQVAEVWCPGTVGTKDPREFGNSNEKIGKMRLKSFKKYEGCAPPHPKKATDHL